MKYEIKDFHRIVKDVGTGKQPEGSMFATTNLVPNKKTGSLTSRTGYTTGFTKPAAMSTLAKHLTFPATYPSSIDYQLYFGVDGSAVQHVWAQPAYHNGSTAWTGDSGWMDLTEKKTFVLGVNPTVTASPTNTIKFNGADTCTALGLNTTANYYKNWVFVFTHGAATSSEVWLVKSYSVTADLATFTLDQVLDGGTTVLPASLVGADFLGLYRYFHQDKTALSANFFGLAYTSPAGYKGETACRFSGGGITAGSKNTKFGYLSKTFFNSDSSNKYVWSGSYCDQAECIRPTSSVLKSLAQGSAAGTNIIIAQKNYDILPANDWTVNGTVPVHTLSTGLYFGAGYGLFVSASAAGNVGTENFSLAAAKSNALSAGASYKITLEYLNFQTDNEARLNVNLDGQTFVFHCPKTDYRTLVGGVKQPIPRTLYQNFTAASGTAQTITAWLDGIQEMVITSFNITLVSSAQQEISRYKTLRYYTTFEYDTFQESDPTYQGQLYLTNSLPKVTAVLKLQLGSLNKFITAIRTYATLEDGDTTTTATTVRTAPLLYMHRVPICDSDTGWALNTATGSFEYTDTILGSDFVQNTTTWEQKTGRVESPSTTCSYKIATDCAGKIFVTQDYDFSESKAYTSRIRNTAINGAGIMCPDIFANILDETIYTVTVGAGNNIQSLREFNGNLIVGKEASTLRINTNEERAFWRETIVSNTVGVLNNDCMQIANGVAKWTDQNNIYEWSGGAVIPLGDEIFAQFYRDNYTSSQVAWIDRTDGSYNIVINTAVSNYYKFMPDNPSPFYQDLTDNVNFAVVLKDGSIYFTSTAGVSYLFNTNVRDLATNFYTYFDTGLISPYNDKLVYLDEVEVDMEIGSASSSGTPQFSVVQDAVETVIPVSDATLKYFRFRVPYKPCRRFGLKWNTNAAIYDFAGTTTVNRIGFKFDVEQEFGDVKAI